jgi:predicted DNA-binding protein YlxM (UPF0122 family)
MFDTNTQYALNKRNANAIVYIDAFGDKTEISPKSLGEDEFARWKALMDAELHEEEKGDHLYHDHTISFGDISLAGYTVPDYETILIEAEERREREELKAQLGVAFFTCLSDIQQARLWLYAIEGFNTCQIAEIEGAAQQSVYESLERAQKNILKFLQKGPCKMSIFAAYSEGAIN